MDASNLETQGLASFLNGTGVEERMEAEVPEGAIELPTVNQQALIFFVHGSEAKTEIRISRYRFVNRISFVPINGGS